MSNDFLNNIFARGQFARTDSPIVAIGGISSNSATLTYDVAHFDSTGNLLVNVIGAVAAGGTTTIAGSVIASQSGTWTVQSLWPQRLDASNDAILAYGSVRTSDISGLMAASGSNIPIITDSLGKVVVLPGAIGDLHLDGQARVAGVLSTTLIAAVGVGRRIAVQSILATGSGSQIVEVIIQGGPSNRTFGFVAPTGGFSLNAGGAPLYITSASTALSVAGSVTSTFNIFVSGYSMSN